MKDSNLLNKWKPKKAEITIMVLGKVNVNHNQSESIKKSITITKKKFYYNA